MLNSVKAHTYIVEEYHPQPERNGSMPSPLTDKKPIKVEMIFFFSRPRTSMNAGRYKIDGQII